MMVPHAVRQLHFDRLPRAFGVRPVAAAAAAAVVVVVVVAMLQTLLPSSLA